MTHSRWKFENFKLINKGLTRNELLCCCLYTVLCDVHFKDTILLNGTTHFSALWRCLRNRSMYQHSLLIQIKVTSEYQNKSVVVLYYMALFAVPLSWPTVTAGHQPASAPMHYAIWNGTPSTGISWPRSVCDKSWRLFLVECWSRLRRHRLGSSRNEGSISLRAL